MRILGYLCFAVMISTSAMANSEMAKNVLSNTTTNPFCSSGYNGPNPYERPSYDRPDAQKSVCEGMDVVQCYRERYKRQ